ncbi:hypothetical protein PM082_020731 [Marasmius tenuissimus]|nr:hypothetical protein PM082_020731 [Marasmius tenuissimus]
MESSLAQSIRVLGQDLYVTFDEDLHGCDISSMCLRIFSHSRKGGQIRLEWSKKPWYFVPSFTLPVLLKSTPFWRCSQVFYLYLLNRYLPLFVVAITLISYFLHECLRYGFMETLETMLLTFTAEVFVGLRVYALSKRRKVVLYATAFALAWQWGIAIYAMSQSSLGTERVQLLLPMDGPPPSVLPELPEVGPYHICIFISVISVIPWVKAFLCISLAFDGVAFVAIAYYSFKIAREQGDQVTDLLRIIQRDGVVYFFVLFSSNLTWLLILFYARSSLQFIHNQPAMILSAIMINRITLNLKEAASNDKVNHVGGWSVRTFEQVTTYKMHRDRITTETRRGSGIMIEDLEMDHVAVGK